MKTKITQIITLLMIFIMGSTAAFAQKGFKQYVGQRSLAGEDTTVFVLEVERAIEKDVASAWEKAIEKKNKVKSQIENDQTIIKGVVINSLGLDTIDIYSTVVQQDTSVVLYTVFMKEGLRVDPNGTEGMSVKVRKLLEQFGIQVYEEVLKREFEEKIDVFKELSKTRDANLKKQDELEKDVQRDSLKIQSAETEINLLQGQLQNTTDRYVAQKSKLSGISKSDKDAMKTAKSDLKEIDKERKGIESEIEKYRDKIIKYKGEIRDYVYELTQLKSDQFSLDSQVEEQRQVVKSAEAELRGF